MGRLQTRIIAFDKNWHNIASNYDKLYASNTNYKFQLTIKQITLEKFLPKNYPEWSIVRLKKPTYIKEYNLNYIN